jgi:5-methylcytosine-specific restriction endonuclease McrA
VGKWNKDTIAEEMKRLSVDGVINSNGRNALNANARRVFGTWKAACEYAGVVSQMEHKRQDTTTMCIVDGCDCMVRSPLAKYCEKHYARIRRYGNTVGLQPREFHDSCLYCDAPLLGTSCRYCSQRCYTRALRNVDRFKSCTICGKRFEAFGRHLTCSASCRSLLKPTTFKKWVEGKRLTDPTWFNKRSQKRDKRRKVKQEGEANINFAAIFGKDEGMCSLCSNPIRLDVRWPHPQSLSFDHVIPIARGGEHKATNLRIAHLVCNIRKHDKMENESRSNRGI